MKLVMDTAGEVTEEENALIGSIGSISGLVEKANEPALDAEPLPPPPSSSALPKSDQVQKRLAVCLFLHITGVSVILLIFPKVRSCSPTSIPGRVLLLDTTH